MHRWTIQDRHGNEIYMTEERWQHIISKHHELIGHLDDVLDTLKKGRRRQERRDPNRYLRVSALSLSPNRPPVPITYVRQPLATAKVDGNEVLEPSHPR